MEGKKMKGTKRHNLKQIFAYFIMHNKHTYLRYTPTYAGGPVTAKTDAKKINAARYMLVGLMGIAILITIGMCLWR
jgi:hypothetical protein